MLWNLFRRAIPNRDSDYVSQPSYMTVGTGILTYAPLPLEDTRNDIYGQPGTWPKSTSDKFKWYNNVFWGNRLPPSDVGVGIPGFNDVPQKLWWTQYSPEQTFNKNWSLTGGPYPYGMSVQQAAQLMLQQQAAWSASAGHGV